MATHPHTLVIRRSSASDSNALERLAELDSGPRMTLDALVAEVDGELRAALRIRDGAVIADPFYPTGYLVELLVARGEMLRGELAGHRRGAPAHRNPTTAPSSRTYLLSGR